MGGVVARSMDARPRPVTDVPSDSNALVKSTPWAANRRRERASRTLNVPSDKAARATTSRSGSGAGTASAGSPRGRASSFATFEVPFASSTPSAGLVDRQRVDLQPAAQERQQAISEHGRLRGKQFAGIGFGLATATPTSRMPEASDTSMPVARTSTPDASRSRARSACCTSGSSSDRTARSTPSAAVTETTRSIAATKRTGRLDFGPRASGPSSFRGRRLPGPGSSRSYAGRVWPRDNPGQWPWHRSRDHGIRRSPPSRRGLTTAMRGSARSRGRKGRQEARRGAARQTFHGAGVARPLLPGGRRAGARTQ